MGLIKTEVNLRRLLEAAPRQQNQKKLIHAESEEITHEVKEESLSSTELAVNDTSSPPRLRRRTIAWMATMDSKNEARERDSIVPVKLDATTVADIQKHRARMETMDNKKKARERDSTVPVKLDATAVAHIQKHRKLQEDLTDEMVGLARQLKESSLSINQSLQDIEKILDSTKRAVEHSLASTGQANKQAVEVYSESFKTTCFQWLVIFVMTCIFIMVALLIRAT